MSQSLVSLKILVAAGAIIYICIILNSIIRPSAKEACLLRMQEKVSECRRLL